MFAYDVGVIGSCMIDFVSYTPYQPKPGETVEGIKFEQGFGGKGANQCVAAARLGASTLFIASLGSDTYGREYLNKLKLEKIDVKYVKLQKNIHSGLAQIIVADNGENTIVIVPGSNSLLSTKDIDNACDAILKCQILLLQFEIPSATVLHALKTYQNHGVSIVNAAPAKLSSEIDPEIFKLCSIFCVNETEAEIITQIQPISLSNVQAALDKFFQLGCKTVIITFGALGVVFATSESKTAKRIITNKVTPKDTTGAGDCFLGALAFFMSKDPNLSLEELIRRACIVATKSVMKQGTQSSYPTYEEVSDELFIQ